MCKFCFNVEDCSLTNSQTVLHEIPTKLYFEGAAKEVLLPSQVHFAMSLVKRGFISKVNS